MLRGFDFKRLILVTVIILHLLDWVQCILSVAEMKMLEVDITNEEARKQAIIYCSGWRNIIKYKKIDSYHSSLLNLLSYNN